MEDNKKRCRVEEEFEDSESEVNIKLARVDSGSDWPDAILNILDESEPVIGPNETIQGLDSVIKSFEDEILVPVPVPIITSDPGESRPELGFLFDASDDELGLPPMFSLVEDDKKCAMDHADEFQIPSSESLERQISVDSDTNGNPTNNSGDFVALEGFFEPAADISEFMRWPETLSAW